MGFLYPRTVSIVRRPHNDAVGRQGYGGTTPGNETPIATGLPASIQWSAAGRTRDARLPADTPSATDWDIYVPKASGLARDAIANRDIATDDQGRRFEIYAAYWNSLGHRLRAQLLEA